MLTLSCWIQKQPGRTGFHPCVNRVTLEQRKVAVGGMYHGVAACAGKTLI